MPSAARTKLDKEYTFTSRTSNSAVVVGPSLAPQIHDALKDLLTQFPKTRTLFLPIAILLLSKFTQNLFLPLEVPILSHPSFRASFKHHTSFIQSLVQTCITSHNNLVNKNLQPGRA